MGLFLTVTRGITWTGEETATAALMNLTATPLVEIPDGSITAPLLDAESFTGEFGDVFRGVNWLPWGTLYYDAFAAATVNCPAGLRTENARAWFVLPAGAAVEALRSARTSSDGTAEAGKCALQVKGAVGLTHVRVGTYLPPGLSAQLYGGNFTFSLYVWNNTGSSLTPSLEISSSNAPGDEGAVTLRSTVAGQACANSQWTRVEFAVNAAALTNFANGARLALLFTVASGVLDASTDYVLVADAQIDKGSATATAPILVPPLLPDVPAGVILPWTGLSTAVPAGWLFCDGTAVSRGVYARLFGVTGTAYGAGDGVTTFNLPDLRGRTWVGAEISGASQSRLEVTLSGTTTSASAVVTFADTSLLRPGMGVTGTGIPAGATLVSLTATTGTLSANATASGTVSLRFNKLGAGDAEVIGTAGNGMASGRNAVQVTKMGCSTASSTTLTVPSLAGLACGMTVSGTGIAAGTTIDAFLSATTVRLSAAATGTASGLTMTFGVDAPEGNQWERYTYLQRNPKMPCVINNAADVKLQTPNDLNVLLEAGMSVTGPAGAGVQAGTYVASLDNNGTDFDLSQATSGATPATYDLTFSGAGMSRGSAPVTDSLPAQIGGWIVKT